MVQDVPITPGLRVTSIDGRFVGTICGVEPNAFLLEQEGEAIRLTRDCIFSAYHGTVTLICHRESLFRYTLPALAPGA